MLIRAKRRGALGSGATAGVLHVGGERRPAPVRAWDGTSSCAGRVAGFERVSIAFEPTGPGCAPSVSRRESWHQTPWTDTGRPQPAAAGVGRPDPRVRGRTVRPITAIAARQGRMLTPGVEIQPQGARNSGDNPLSVWLGMVSVHWGVGASGRSGAVRTDRRTASLPRWVAPCPEGGLDPRVGVQGFGPLAAASCGEIRWPEATCQMAVPVAARDIEFNENNILRSLASR